MHDQAVSRAYRIGQKKEVHEIYLDARDTFDDVMRTVMDTKSNNATVVLADGTELGQGSCGGLSYQESAGMCNEMLAMIARRNDRADGLVFTPDPKAKGKAKAKADAKPKAEPKPKPKVHAKPNAEPKPQAKAKADAKSEAQPNPQAKAKARAAAASGCCCS